MTKFASADIARNTVLCDGKQDIKTRYGNNFQTSFSIQKEATDNLVQNYISLSVSNTFHYFLQSHPYVSKFVYICVVVCLWGS